MRKFFEPKILARHVIVALNQFIGSKTMKKNTGIMRLFYAGIYSWQGFKSALVNEAPFREEFIAAIPLVGLSFYLDVSAYERLAMIASLVFILIVEILNSAIECVVDRISTEHHVLSGRAKDYGSLAVLLSIFIAVATWAVILI
jgi:diacylglycerol kinase (ATP)